ncbi:hypothetical protein GCM10010402_63640 [Actinomadura luteofluorescens]|uniref:Uncharacterized protein n=1 Tax=Actinomadura luteofluorescens TaxID=46163 RepID=A0A7Y9JI59_9ACTN|nr:MULTISPECIES: hypothetical protein [Actinomadura]MCR3741825.1 hypothetical protein [Actinomadura glauciflava]NYD49660.1 hypothetical protein [Actinomadura luteofluorescens]
MAEKNPQRFDNPTQGMGDTNAKILKNQAELSPTGQVDVQSGHNGAHHTITTVSGSQSADEIKAQVEQARNQN